MQGEANDRCLIRGEWLEWEEDRFVGLLALVVDDAPAAPYDLLSIAPPPKGSMTIADSIVPGIMSNAAGSSLGFWLMSASASDT